MRSLMCHWAGAVVSVAGRLPGCGLRFVGSRVWLLVAGLVLGQSVLAQSPGALDTAFTPSITGGEAVVRAVAVQSNGQIVIGGEFTGVNGTGRSNLARLNADGTLDTGFNPGVGGGLFPGVFALAIQSDGRILIGGEFSTVNGVGRNNLARLNADGTLDESFNPGTGISGGVFPQVHALAVQSDGRIIVGGEFTSVNGVGRNNLARLNANGTLDESFNPGTGIGGVTPSVQAAVVQSDGRVLVAGVFSSVNGVGRNNIARLNANGSLDTGFNPGTGPDDTVQALAVQPDGKVLIAGFFANVNGVARSRVARLNADGSLDTGFAGGGANDVVFGLVLQPDGRIVIGGEFTSAGGSGRNRIARLAANGNLDTSFDPGSGVTGGFVLCLALQSNGRVLLGGSFTTVGGTARPSLARLFGGESGGGGGGGSCTYTIVPGGVVAPAGGATGTITVTAGTGCAWTATSNVPWATITSGASGSGNGTVGYSITANTGATRTGTLTVAGQTFTISQSAAATCTYSIAPTSVNIVAGGGSGTVSVTAGAGCAWTATSNVPWATITGGPSGSGKGTVGYAVAANSGPARTGTLTIAGQTFTIEQAATATCTYSIAPTSVNIAPDGGSGTVSVTAGAGCAWTATSNVPWATITGGASGNGNGTVGYAVSANTGAPRTGTLTIAGQTFTIEQAAGGTGCFYTVTPSVLNVGGDAVPSVTVTVTTGAGCAWEATVRNTDAPWVKLVSAQLASGQVVTPRMVGELGDVNRRLALTGTGSATVTLAVGRNPGGAARTGTVLVAGQVVTVTQAGGSGGGAPLGATMAMFRPSNGYMYLKNRLISDFADQDFFYGTAGDAPIAGDWDGDGIDTPGIYRNVNGVMTFFLINNNTGGFADVSFAFGQPGDIPIAGDWDGNGTVTCGVYRPGSQTFFLRNANTGGNPDLTVVITGAQASDRPVAGRWVAGSPVTGVGLYRPGNGQFLLKNANVSGAADASFVVTTTGTVVAPVAGDWTRQGFATVGVVVSLGGTIQFQLRTSNTAGPPELRVNYGAPGDVPLIGNWDGQIKLPPVSVP
jgi:uncharacterized delta-60 repeat protein